MFGLFSRREPEYAERALSEIRSLGSNSVSIVIPWVTPDASSLVLSPRDDMTPSDSSLRRAIREAHRMKMSVFLMPLVYVDRVGPEEWRGTLRPSDWGAWFAAYGKMILHYAALGRQEKVEYLCVGSELGSSEHLRTEWLSLIANVRAVYEGGLTYSANWDHLEAVSFLDALDFAGMNAYFELANDPDAGVEDLVTAWKAIIEDVEVWRSRSGKPLILTEVGFPSRRGALSDPWRYEAVGAVDLGVQERAYRAFVEAWTGYPALAGVYFYLWWGEGGREDGSYTPRGKPAEKVIAEWFTRG